MDQLLDKEPDFIFSHSSIQLFQTCPRKFYYKRLSRWESLSEAVPLVRGKALHQGIETFFKTLDKKKALDSCTESIVQAKLFQAEKDLILPIVENTLDLYLSDPSLAEMNILENELELVRELAPGIKYLGKIDSVVEFRGIRFLRETKSTTQLASQWEQKYSLDNQTLGYLWLYNQEDTRGIILDLIRLPDGKKTKHPDFVRSAYFPDVSLIPAWQEERTEIAKAMIDSTTWPKNTASCFDYNRACEFFPFCSGSLPESELPNMFTQRVREEK